MTTLNLSASTPTYQTGSTIFTSREPWQRQPHDLSFASTSVIYLSRSTPCHKHLDRLIITTPEPGMTQSTPLLSGERSIATRSEKVSSLGLPSLGLRPLCLWLSERHGLTACIFHPRPRRHSRSQRRSLGPQVDTSFFGLIIPQIPRDCMPFPAPMVSRRHRHSRRRAKRSTRFGLQPTRSRLVEL